MKNLLISIGIVACLAFSCKQQETFIRPAIKLVDDILLSKNSKEYSLLSNPTNPKPSGDIIVIANSQSAEQLSEYFVQYDEHDNVDGQKIKDELPDFAGETFVTIQSGKSFKNIDTLKLRYYTVKTVLASLDTLIHLSPYDIEGVKGKNVAKTIILSDPYLTKYGLFDVDTLFKRSSCGINIVSSLNLSIEKALSNKARNIAIFYNPTLYDAKPILDCFVSKAPQGTKFIAYPVNCADSLLYNVAENLLQKDMKLDALVVDDYSLDIDALKLEYADMISMLNPSSLLYSKCFSDNFQIIDTKELVADYCFNLLRRENLFTHTIAYPQVNVLNAVENKDGNILLIPNSYVQE